MDLKSLVLSGVPQIEETLHDGRKIKLRSFLVKELKLLMLAKEGGAEDKTLLQVMQQCVLTPDIDLEMVPSFDLEMLFLKLFMLSKGSMYSEVAFICQNEVDDKVCGHKLPVRVNLKTVKLSNDVEADNLIKVNESMTLSMRYPTVLEQDYFTAVKTAGEGAAKLIDMCLNCVSTINANGQSLTVGVDISKEELAELMELVSGEVFEKITKFIETVPYIHTHLALKCPKCGHEESVELKGIADFFD